MRSLILLGLMFLIVPSRAAALISSQVKKDVIKLSSLKAQDMLRRVRQNKICVKILESGRPVPKPLFSWGQIEKPSGKLEDLSKIPGLMGKSLCADEIPLARDCLTIAIAADAPRTTLLHEYLHAQQIKSDPSWCPLSKAAWETGKMSPEAHRAMLDREWEVHTWLWENRDKLQLSVEDKVEVVSTLLSQAEIRSSFDPSAKAYIAQQKASEYLNAVLIDYKKLLGLK